MGTSTATGSLSDQLNAVVIQLKRCEDLRRLEWAFPRISRALEDIARRAGLTRARGGRPPNLDAALAWLTTTVEEHPAFAEPGGEGLRDELLRLAHRVRHAR